MDVKRVGLVMAEVRQGLGVLRGQSKAKTAISTGGAGPAGPAAQGLREVEQPSRDPAPCSCTAGSQHGMCARHQERRLRLGHRQVSTTRARSEVS